ncbi:hypothetical protein ACHAPA_006105 [Fusarium lateritium]
MAPSKSNNASGSATRIPSLKGDAYAASIKHRNMLEEFGHKYHALGIDAGHAMGVEAGLAQAEEEIELRIATATEDSREVIAQLIEKRTKDNEDDDDDDDLANEAHDAICSVVSSVDKLLDLPRIPLDTYTEIREKCVSLEIIRDKFSKKLGKSTSPILRKRRRDANETDKTVKVKREKRD